MKYLEGSQKVETSEYTKDISCWGWKVLEKAGCLLKILFWDFLKFRKYPDLKQIWSMVPGCEELSLMLCGNARQVDKSDVKKPIWWGIDDASIISQNSMLSIPYSSHYLRRGWMWCKAKTKFAQVLEQTSLCRRWTKSWGRVIFGGFAVTDHVQLGRDRTGAKPCKHVYNLTNGADNS